MDESLSNPAGEPLERDARQPYLSDDGILVIPRDCDEKYRWWNKGGLSIAEILRELKASQTVWHRYLKDEYPDDLRKEVYPLLGQD